MRYFIDSVGEWQWSDDEVATLRCLNGGACGTLAGELRSLCATDFVVPKKAHRVNSLRAMLPYSHQGPECDRMCGLQPYGLLRR